jgi:hypothetical protein
MRATFPKRIRPDGVQARQEFHAVLIQIQNLFFLQMKERS